VREGRQSDGDERKEAAPVREAGRRHRAEDAPHRRRPEGHRHTRRVPRGPPRLPPGDADGRRDRDSLTSAAAIAPRIREVSERLVGERFTLAATVEGARRLHRIVWRSHSTWWSGRFTGRHGYSTRWSAHQNGFDSYSTWWRAHQNGFDSYSTWWRAHQNGFDSYSTWWRAHWCSVD